MIGSASLGANFKAQRAWQAQLFRLGPTGTAPMGAPEHPGHSSATPAPLSIPTLVGLG